MEKANKQKIGISDGEFVVLNRTHNGQKALDESILVKVKGSRNLETRVGIENGIVVKFQEHLPGEFHGYIVEGKLDIHSQNALKTAGLMNKSGKIIK